MIACDPFSRFGRSDLNRLLAIRGGRPLRGTYPSANARFTSGSDGSNDLEYLLLPRLLRTPPGRLINPSWHRQNPDWLQRRGARATAKTAGGCARFTPHRFSSLAAQLVHSCADRLEIIGGAMVSKDNHNGKYSRLRWERPDHALGGSDSVRQTEALPAWRSQPRHSRRRMERRSAGHVPPEVTQPHVHSDFPHLELARGTY
jgi:hypothetical protein